MSIPNTVNMVKTFNSLNRKRKRELRAYLQKATEQRQKGKQRECSEPCSTAGQSIKNDVERNQMVKTFNSLNRKRKRELRAYLQKATEQRQKGKQRECSEPCSTAGQSIKNDVERNQEDTLTEEKVDHVKVLSKCRLCLREITSLATPIWGDSGIYEIVNRCCPMTVFETDKFQFVCLRCKHHLDCVDKFQQMCLRSNEIFLKMTLIKKEDPFSYSLNEDEVVIEPPSEYNMKFEEIRSHEDERAIEPLREYNIKFEEIHSYEDELVIEPLSEYNMKFEEIHSHEDEIVIEPLSEADIKLEEIHSHGEEEAIETATIFETEDEKEQEFLCEKCPMISFEEEDSFIHLMSHIEGPTKRVKQEVGQINLCPICGKTLKVLRFDKHVLLHTQPPQPKECDECGKIYSGPTSLRTHKLRHQSVALHECTLCGLKLKFKIDLERHMRRMHCQKQESISCPHCDRKFRNRYNMRVHLRTHTGEMPFSCPDCGISFAHRVTMKLHRLKEHKVDMFDPPTQKDQLKIKRRRKTNKTEDVSPSQDA